MVEKLGLAYDGKLASTGRLKFYEYGRAAYAYGRFLETLNTFRRTERVPKRITRMLQSDLLIEAPRQGSFYIEIIVPVLQNAAGNLAAIPLQALVEYVFGTVQRIRPEHESAITRAAEAQLAIEEQRTLQSAQETERLKVIQEIIKGEKSSNSEWIKFINSLLEKNSPALSELGGSSEAREIKEQMQLQQDRDKRLDQYAAQFDSVSPGLLLSLSSKVRPQIEEMAVPLRDSADAMLFTSSDSRSVSARLGEEDVQDIASRQMDAQSARKRVRVAAYDRDTGRGKLDLIEDGLTRISYGVDRAQKLQLQPLILAAIDEPEVTADIRMFRNLDGAITSVVVEGIVQREH